MPLQTPWCAEIFPKNTGVILAVLKHTLLTLDPPCQHLLQQAAAEGEQCLVSSRGRFHTYRQSGRAHHHLRMGHHCYGCLLTMQRWPLIVIRKASRRWSIVIKHVLGSCRQLNWRMQRASGHSWIPLSSASREREIGDEGLHEAVAKMLP